jgi:hypothetical protein
MDLVFPESEEIHAWEQFLWGLPEEFMSRPQRLQFILMLTTRFNLFTPLPVVRDLLANRHLWFGMVMDRGVLQPRAGQYSCAKIRTNLIKLRDVSSKRWNVDTVFLTTLVEHVVALNSLAESWNASAITILPGEVADDLMGIGRSEHSVQIIGVWWD